MLKETYFYAGMAIVILILFPFAVGGLVTWVGFLVGMGLAVYISEELARKGRLYREAERKTVVPFMTVTMILLPFVLGAITFFEGYRGGELLYRSLLAASLAITFFVNLLSIPLAIQYRKRELDREGNGTLRTYPSVSIIVPAYNEEKWISRCIEALLEADYPRKEIIVVDDGSTDNTYGIASQYSRMGVKVVHKENGGKASAINYGLLFATGEIIVTVDADGVVSRESLKRMVAEFDDPRVVGVAGNIKVVNRVNWLTRCQALEYIMGINMLRRATAYLGVVQVLPGPLSAFRRSVVEGIGKYDKDTVTEDFDVTVKLLKAGGIVQADSRAMAFTEAPARFRDLYRQRIRWYRGNLQVFLKHRDVLANPRFGFLNYLIFPLLTVQMLILPALGLLIIFAAVLTILRGGLIDVVKLSLFFILLQALEALMTITLDDEDRRLVLYSPLFVFGYKNILDIFLVKSLIDVLLLRRKFGWTRATRVGYAMTPQRV